ncbi:hypothetical protein Tco_0212367 [Tanacetum coccineum]
MGTTQPTATITSTEDLQRVAFTTPPQTAPGTNSTEPPPPPIRNKGPELGADNLTLEGVATELAPSDFVSQNYETLVALMQEETKKRSSQSLQARLNFGPEDEISPPRHRKERRREDNRRPPVFGRIGKQVSGTQTANLQNLNAHENNDWRISVHDRLGSRDVHSRLGQRRSSSESPPSSDSEDSRRKRRRRVSVSSEDTSDNEDAETGHWKSKNRYREDEDMSLPWRRQKVDAFTRRISDFYPREDKEGRMPANVKTYDGTGLFRLNFTQGRSVPKNPVELARVKQRQGESTSVYVERYKDECIHVKACPEILKISGLDHLVKNIKEGKDKQRGGGKKDAPRDKADTIYMVQSWQRKTKQKVSQKFSQGSTISFPTLTTDNVVVEPLTIEINAAGHDIHRMYIDGGASADILYEHCFQRLRPEVKIIVGNKEHSTTMPGMEFYGDQSPSAIKQWHISGRPGIPSSDTRDSEAARNQSNKLEGRDSSRLPRARGDIPQWRQKKRGQLPERAKAFWRSYGQKSDGSWRMCVDFTDLNKACPQDCYPLPEIDWKVESLRLTLSSALGRI